jgi:hypothetical protein
MFSTYRILVGISEGNFWYFKKKEGGGANVEKVERKQKVCKTSKYSSSSNEAEKMGCGL